jgi:iron transport multicopper oxidase
MTDGTNRAMFNNLTFNFPKVPTVFSEYSMGQDANNVAIYGPGTYVLEKGDVIDITVTNLDAGKHPL